VANRIVDSSSIEVNRRRRRTKTDRLDVVKLVTMWLRAKAGEAKVWSVVNVPSSVEEDRRQVHRELLFARRDRGRHTNRMKGLRLLVKVCRSRSCGSSRRICERRVGGMGRRCRRCSLHG
jgi:transposase